VRQIVVRPTRYLLARPASGKYSLTLAGGFRITAILQETPLVAHPDANVAADFGYRLIDVFGNSLLNILDRDPLLP